MNPEADAVIRAVTKQYGVGSAFKMSEAPQVQISGWTPTGSSLVDGIIGREGLPDGRVTTIIGDPSAGKTTLAQAIICEFQQRGGIPYLIPAEPFDRERAIQLGVDPSNIVVFDAGTVEQNFGCIDLICENSSGVSPSLVLWDSFSASPTKAELEADAGFESKAMAEHARLVSQQMRKLQSKMERKNVTLVVILQSKKKVGITFGEGVTYLAERPWYFYSYVQLECKRIGYVKKGEETIGIRMKVKCRKNKVGVPFRECEAELLFDSGIDDAGPLLEKGVQHGIIGVRGKGRFFIGFADGNQIKFTRREWPKILRDNPQLDPFIRQYNPQQVVPEVEPPKVEEVQPPQEATVSQEGSTNVSAVQEAGGEGSDQQSSGDSSNVDSGQQSEASN